MIETRRKVILHLIETTGPGGAETVFLNTVNGLDRRVFESVVILTGGGWLHDRLKAAGMAPVIAKTCGAFDWRFLREIITCVRSRKVDLIHSHLPDVSSYACLAGLLTRTPVVVTFHGMVGEWKTRSAKNQIKMALIKRLADHVVTVSDHLGMELVRDWSFMPGQITRIYNGVDFESFDRSVTSDALRAEFGIPASATLIASVGNIREAKGYDYLLNAARRVIDAAANTYFLIAGQGKGELLGKLEALRERLGLQKNVILAGFRGDVPQFLRQCDLFVLSSTTEGLSIATIEAMGLGKPVVVTDSGGPAEIVCDGKTGLLVPSQDAGALADGILRFIRDRELADELGSAARSAVRDKFDLEHSVRRYAELYRLCLR